MHESRIAHRVPSRAEQSGATLVVGLVMLLVLTVIGVSGMNTATMEVTMAGNAQFQQDAFQMAETAIDIPIAQRSYTTVAPTVLNWLNAPDYDRHAVTTFQMTTPVPDIAFSMGSTTGSVQAFHFDIVAVGRGPRNATSQHNQSFYVVGPGGS
jgi:type IV pilus assembly protein PilX